MKGIITATLATLLLTTISLPANAKFFHQGSKADKKQIALTLQGGTSKDTTISKGENVGIGSDYTSEWSGGHGDLIITGSGF